MIQNIFVFFIIAIAVVFMGRHFGNLFNTKQPACDGCNVKNICHKKKAVKNLVIKNKSTTFAPAKQKRCLG